MNETIEFEIYGLDRKNLNKIKRSFNLNTDVQAIVFSLGWVAENTALIKHKTKRANYNAEKKEQRIRQKKVMRKNVLKQEEKYRKKAKNTAIWDK